MNEKSPDATEVQTMWSESLLEILYVSLRKDKEDDVIKEVINDLHAKKYDDEYIINKVNQKVGLAAGKRVTAIIAGRAYSSPAKAQKGKPLSAAAQVRAKLAKKRSDVGLIEKIKDFFGLN